jgi:hypothetical protein
MWSRTKLTNDSASASPSRRLADITSSLMPLSATLSATYNGI